jgi:diguanylate cyclase (GGDEF)-like protein
MQNLNPVRRILTIDDNDAIHGDFRKILVHSATPSKLAGVKALLFDDQPVVASSKVHFEVDSALQGEEGLAKVAEALSIHRPYSVAFVDMRMPPGWDGLQTIQKLWEADPDLQVVICSAFSDYSWDEICDKLGLTDRLLILKKPFDAAEVSQIAIALSEKWELRRAARMKMDDLERMVSERTVELTFQAQHDKLTGLANRNLFNDRLAQAVRKSSQSPGYAFAILFLDFDRFKLINDSCGHATGDRVLKGIADRLTVALSLAGERVGDAIAARMGGDEFTILIDGTTKRLDPVGFADSLLKILDSPYKVDGYELHCTASIGLTSSSLHYENAEHALRDADTAMYHAKAAGKARYALFDQRMHETATHRIELETDLRHAIERNQLVLHFQPIMELATGRLTGFEALVRWNHPVLGMLPPGEFIPCCEEIGLISPVGLWVMNNACEQMKQWQTRYPQMAKLGINVNVSAKQMLTPHLVADLAEVLTRTNLDPSLLTIEITESATFGEVAQVVDMLNQIRALGINLDLDDFGTGYAALSSVHLFPITGLKIDSSFVTDITLRREYRAVVQSVIDLGHNLDMKLTAEGIENAQQLELLKNMGCQHGQGFYFAQPQPADLAEQLIIAQVQGRAMAA